MRPGFTPFYAGLIELRKAHSALTSGDVEWLHNSDEARVVTFLRQAPGETLLVAVNLSSRPFSGQVQGTHGDFLNITPPVARAPGGSPQSASRLPALDLPAWGYRIYRSTSGH
jgi:glycosidase